MHKSLAALTLEVLRQKMTEDDAVQQVGKGSRASFTGMSTLTAFAMSAIVARVIMRRMLVLREHQLELDSHMKLVVYGSTVGGGFVAYFVTYFGLVSYFEHEAKARARTAMASARVYSESGVNIGVIVEQMNKTSEARGPMILFTALVICTVMCAHRLASRT